MIIIAYKPGYLANRLFHFAKFLAYGLKHGVLIFNPSFDDYAKYFIVTSGQLVPSSHGLSGRSIKWLITSIFRFLFILARVIHRTKLRLSRLSVTHLDWHEHYDLDNDLRLSKDGIHFIQGWEFDAQNLLNEFRPQIINYFSPKKSLEKDIDTVFGKIKSGSRLVGVHIRQGDYLYFEGGRYYYEIHQYKDWMDDLRIEKPETRFLICTNNREISDKDFEGFAMDLAPGHELVDLYLLAKCDYLMGPPSTYSLWASYYGDRPLLQLKDQGQHVSFNDFVKWGN